MELAPETACYGTLQEEELGSRETLSFGFPGRASLRWLSGGRPPARFCLPASSEESLGSLGRRASGGSWGVGWAAWPVSVQIAVARPPHPHATPSMSGPAWLRQGSSYYYYFFSSSQK